MNLTPSNRHTSNDESERKTAFTSASNENKTRSEFGDLHFIGDNRFFTSLINPLEAVQTTQPQTSTPQHSSTQIPLISSQLDAIGSSIDKQLPNTPGSEDFQCVMLLPNLGEVHLDATFKKDIWHVNLAFVKPEALLLARQQSHFLSQRFQQKMGKHVILGLSEKGSTND